MNHQYANVEHPWQRFSRLCELRHHLVMRVLGPLSEFSSTEQIAAAGAAVDEINAIVDRTDRYDPASVRKAEWMLQAYADQASAG
ncbi:hypothetical protein ACFVWR_02185 [Leifsonia sp. NPDC058292]|uniref:hypothetical protein n=1 Tax=Leifsonia sp. NPDC058292 TaxID=3346428 RepID=UPI0036DA3F0B